jgi:hypothetical protein
MCNNLVTTKQAHVEGLAFETGIITQLPGALRTAGKHSIENE